MAHKTLIVGLGTSGAEIVSGVIDRVVARFGSLQAAPWLQVVAFDTDKVRGTTTNSKGLSVADSNNAVHVGLPSDDFQTFKLNPASLDSMDFAEWQDPNVFQVSAASDQGASNIRMIGRASLLHPKTLAKVHGEVKRRLDFLRTLDLAQAAHEAGLVLTPPVSNDAYWIYVCGSLTGGTCSGTFIDLGYYLRELQQVGESFAVYGILGMPHPQAGSPRHKANAYQALRELNHFLSDGALYEQKLPLPTVFPRPIRKVAETPFRSSMLIVPRAPDDRSKAESYAAVSEFLATVVTTTMSDALYAKVVDPGAAFFGLRSRGRHLNFQSLGAAVIEFPADHIGRACGCRLVEGALGEWLSQPGLDPSEASARLEAQGITLDAVRKRLLRAGDGEADIVQEVQACLSRARTAMAGGDAGAATLAFGRIEEAFKSAPPVPDGLGPYRAISLINGNQSTTQDTVLAEFVREVEEAVVTLERGPNWCLGYAKAVVERCDAILREATAPERHEELRAKESRMRKKEELVREATGSTLLGITGWRKTATRRFAGEWHAAATEYWRRRLEEACAASERMILGALKARAELAVNRIEGHEMALLKLARRVRISADAEHRTLDGKAPETNGHLVFTPGATVGTEFQRAMNMVAPVAHPRVRATRAGEDYAKALVVAEWELLREALTVPEGQSPFDSRPAATDQTAARQVDGHRDSLARWAYRRFFGSLDTRDVLSELFGSQSNPSGDAEAIVAEVLGASSAFVQVNDNESPLGPILQGDPRTPTFAFYPQAGSSVWPYARFASLIGGAVPQGNHIASNDPTRVLVLQSRTTFAAGSLAAVASYEPFLQVAAGDGTSPRLDARADVVWRSLEGGPLHPNIDEGMGLFLLALAIGGARARNDRPGFTLSYGGTEMRVKPDVELAGLAVVQSTQARAFLRQELGRLSQPGSRSVLVERMRQLVEHHSVYFPGLTYKQQPLTAEFVEYKLLETMRLVPALQSEYLRQYGARFSMVPRDYLVAAGALPPTRMGQTRPAGYYCDSSECSKYLGDPQMQPTAFPEKCPECGKQLLVPGYHEIAAARGDAQPAVAGGAGAFAPPNAAPMAATDLFDAI